MDQQPNPDPHPKVESASQDSPNPTNSTPQPHPRPDPDPKLVDNNNHNHNNTPNGDANKATGSDSQAVAPPPPDDDQLKQQQQQPNLTGSGRKSVHWSPDLVTESHASPNLVNEEDKNVSLDGSNPYISSSPAQSSTSQFNFKDTMGTVRDVLGRWGKRMGEATRKAEDLAGNTWQHLKTAPSFTDAALGRIAQGTKILAEGGYEKIFQQTFETVPEEQLQNSFACYLSTSAGPVMGILYVSTAKLAYCSDNPLSYKSGGQIEWSYYKVVMPLHQLKSVNPSSSRANPSEKYIQVISVDNHEFWFMGFLNYDGAVNCLKDALQA